MAIFILQVTPQTILIANSFSKKFNQFGEFLWDVRYNPSSETDNPRYISLDKANNVYMLGNIDDGNEAGGVALVKFDSAGNFLWDQKILSITSNSFGLVIDTDQSPVICGYHSLNTSKTFFVKKYSQEGAEHWTQLIHTVNFNILRSASLTANLSGGIYFTASLDAEVPNFADVFLAKYNSDGNEIWETRYNSPSSGFDIPIKIGLDGDQNILVSVWSYDSVADGNILTLKYSQPTGISSSASNSTLLQVFPNPFQSTTSLQIPLLESINKNLRLEIFDLPGRFLRKENIQQSGNYTLSRGTIDKGMYLVKLISENKVIGTAKIVIQ